MESTVSLPPIEPANFNTRLVFVALALSIFFVLVLFAWQGNKGFSLWDEGSLWYGAQRVMLGEVPIRDFMSYDPGRYYWSAGFMSLWGDNGVMTLRGTVAAFQAIGLFVGILLIGRTIRTVNKRDFFYLLLSAITLVVWMFPRHKLFDISISILLMGVLSLLVRHPTGARYFFTGLCIGLAAVFGRNHGVYGVAGSLGVMLWLNIKRSEGICLAKGFGLWSSGVLVGFSPIILMVLLVPSFAVAFWESIRLMIEMKTCNLPLPIPWPWRVNFSVVSLEEAIRGVLIGLFFIGIVVFGALSILWVVRQKLLHKQVSPELVAASFLSLPYVHHAYGRADINHLCQSIFPLLIGCLVLLAKMPAKPKWSLTLMLCAVSLWMVPVFYPGWYCHAKQCVKTEISGNILALDPATANDIALLRRLAAKYAPNGRSFVATPFWPGAYALLEIKSPMREIYAVFPRSEEFQKKEIERIKIADPGFVLVLDIPLDGRDDLRFRNSYPLIYHFIEKEFKKIERETNNPTYLLFINKKNKKSNLE